MPFELPPPELLNVVGATPLYLMRLWKSLKWRAPSFLFTFTGYRRHIEDNSPWISRFFSVFEKGSICSLSVGCINLTFLPSGELGAKGGRTMSARELERYSCFLFPAF